MGAVAIGRGQHNRQRASSGHKKFPIFWAAEQREGLNGRRMRTSRRSRIQQWTVNVKCKVASNNQSPSAARGLRYRKWPFAKEQCFGGFGGFPPHYRACPDQGRREGGFGGFLPPILGRTWHPLRREGGFGGDPPPHSRAYLTPWHP